MDTARSNTGPRRRRRPTKTGVVLTEEVIVRTAMRLIEDPEGTGFSVRRLGIALGADPTAVYRYFENVEDLMRAITDQMIGDSLEGGGVSGDWRATLRDFGMRFYRHAQRHPRLAVLGVWRVSLRAHEFRAVDTGIGALLDAGLDPRSAVQIYHAFIDTVLGFAALDAAGAPANGSPEAIDAWTSTYTGFPADEYPHLAATRDHIHLMAWSAFETTLDLVLDGVDARITGRI